MAYDGSFILCFSGLWLNIPIRLFCCLFAANHYCAANHYLGNYQDIMDI